MEYIAPQEFDPEEANTNAQGADYEQPAKLLHTYTTGDHEHFWESHGIQETGEQVVRCKDCPLGMELEPDRQVIDGKIIW